VLRVSLPTVDADVAKIKAGVRKMQSETKQSTCVSCARACDDVLAVD
jgi:hypothetical protein